MNPYIAHLKSEIPCTVYANGEYLGLCEKRKSLDLEVLSNNIYFNVFPVGHYYPYTIHISNFSHCTDTTNNTLIVPYYNNNYDIYLKSIKIYENLPTKHLFSKTIGKTTVTIVNGINSSLTIYDNGTIVYSDNIKLLSNASVNMVNNNLVLKGYTTTDEYYLLILNNNYELIHSGYFEKLEENNNTLTGFSNIYDIAKHGHICEIDLYNTENINEYYVVKDDISVCESKQLIPKAFLEAIKVQNFSLAKKYLNDSLCKASNLHFKTYFGTIQSIYYNAYNNSNPVNYTVYNGEYKSYNFKVCDNKICDIEECKL